MQLWKNKAFNKDSDLISRINSVFEYEYSGIEHVIVDGVVQSVNLNTVSIFLSELLSYIDVKTYLGIAN